MEIACFIIYILLLYLYTLYYLKFNHKLLEIIETKIQKNLIYLHHYIHCYLW